MTLTQERLKELLQYNAETGLFTRLQNKGTKKKGEVAGYDVSGYVYITIDNVAYPAHRLAFLYENGTYPDCDVDHKNMDRKDNRFINLRVAGRRKNMLNISSHKDSELGKKNIFFRKDTNTYSVRATVNNRYKSFGCYKDLELAELVAGYVREKYHKEYARD